MNPKSVFNYNGSAKSIDNVSLYVFVAEVIWWNAINSLVTENCFECVDVLNVIDIDFERLGLLLATINVHMKRPGCHWVLMSVHQRDHLLQMIGIHRINDKAETNHRLIATCRQTNRTQHLLTVRAKDHYLMNSFQ